MTGKRILMTGASSGIGAATAALFIEDGDEVVSLDIKDAPPGVARHVRCDLADPRSIDEAVAAVAGEFDVLLNIAGVPGTLDPELVMRVNTLGLRRLTEAMLDRIADRGAIVSVASIAGFNWARRLGDIVALLEMDDYDAALEWCRKREMDGDGAYAFSKECVVVYTMQLAGRLAHRGIRCNSVSPGPVATPLLPEFKAQTAAGQIDWLIEEIGRAAEPREIGDVIQYLATGASSYVNGRDLIVDGGLSAGLTMGWIDKKRSPAYRQARGLG